MFALAELDTSYIQMNTDTFQPPRFDRWLHVYAVVVVAVTAVLIYAGGLVTTIGAGLAVPDWPLSFGSLNPSGWWKQPMVREEHGHRVIGAIVGLLTLILFFWLRMRGPREWLRKLGALALGMVILQGILGGLRVIEKNIAFAIVHACLAQAFFCVLIALAWGTSASWLRDMPCRTDGQRRRYRPLALSVCAVVFIQLMIGAVMRHGGAGMAIPTFPLVDGGLVPAQWDFDTAIHYAHRVWACMVVIAVAVLYLVALKHFTFWPRMMAALAMALVVIQVLIGGSIIWTGRAIVPTTLHVLVGAMILGLSFSCFLWLLHPALSAEALRPASEAI